MEIRRAKLKDMGGIMKLLSQVLEVHAAIRPDLFISGKTKYTNEQLEKIIGDDKRPVYVGVNAKGDVLGYAFCVLTSQPETECMTQFDSLYIDDLCVDENMRGQNIAKRIFEHVRSEAKRLGCREITLNVWEGNDSARAFYDNMGFKPLKTMMEYIL